MRTQKEIKQEAIIAVLKNRAENNKRLDNDFFEKK